MPIHNASDEHHYPSFGNLYVKFDIKFPHRINEDIQNKLKEFLLFKNNDQSFCKSNNKHNLTNSIIDIHVFNLI